MSTSVRNAGERIEELVRRTHIFHDWPAPLVSKLVEGAELRRYADGEFVIRAGQTARNFPIVATGEFVNQGSQKDGGQIIFDYLMPGQACFHAAIFDGHPIVFDIVSQGESEMGFIARQALMEALALDPARLMDFVLMFCRRTRLSHANVHMRMASSVRGQLARLILYWLRGQEPSGAMRVPMGISQDNIATILGVSRPTVNKEIGAMIGEGILARRYRQLEVLNVYALADIVERESPGFLATNIPIFTKPGGVLIASD